MLGACPVCPFAEMTADMLACPSCGSDLTVLRRVQELPLVLLDDAIRLARAGDLDAARQRCGAAATSPRTRAAALALLAKCELGAGHPRAARRAWRAARRALEDGPDEGVVHLSDVVAGPVWSRGR